MGLVTDRPVEVRAAEPSDRRAILDLLSASLGWQSDERFDGFFTWKHEQNPFGRSPGWVALDDGCVVGFRTFMRWKHVAPGGELIRTVRAVDTATHPEYQGLGIFRRLTLQALDDLRAEGTAFVFNTPNDTSRSGYLKMGWTQVGRLRASMRVTSPAGLARMAHARLPADLWSVSATGGRPAPDVLGEPGLADLLRSVARPRGLGTRLTPSYLRWRYGLRPLAYRAVTAGADVGAGIAIFRLRRRGPALECVLCEVLAPAGDRGAHRALVHSVVRQSGADYVIRLGGPPIDGDGFMRAPGQGPILTWYPLWANVAGRHLNDWSLTLGDLELF